MREQFIVEGLGGERRLAGEIPVRGAKNAVLKSMAASLLFEDTVTITNTPYIEDVDRVRELLEDLGATVTRENDVCEINASTVVKSDLDDRVARTLRASIVFTGPLVGRFGRVSFPHPGGDVIGPRPINLFIDGFKKMGCEVVQEGDRYVLTTKGGLHGAEIFFMFVTVTGTETLMMAAVLAHGTTVLKNAAMEPEIVELAEFLVSCGARISGAGTPTIIIEGLDGHLLCAQKKQLRTTPDRIEAGTFLLLGALAARELLITDCNPGHCDMLIALLRESGVHIETTHNSIALRANGAQRAPLQVRTHEYPGFATDLQPPMMVYLTQTSGESTIFETIWGGRLAYTQDLVRMGADITMWNSQQASIKGPTPLMGRELESPDIRAGLAFLMASAIASGTSKIDNIYHIDRGYEHIEERLSKLGLDIRRQYSV
jgi:UDP-N-acetylglucosamine 1-carboxyvinyltransferase